MVWKRPSHYSNIKATLIKVVVDDTDFVKHCRRMRIQLKEKGRYNQNHAAEREIGFLSERWRRRMAKKSVPRRLWDFGLVYEAELLSRLSRARDGRTGYEEVFGLHHVDGCRVIN